MKVNTDGVLVGALANVEEVHSILDIGTGTGVISLMLAQRQPGAMIDAVEIDEVAAATAIRNFKASPFGNRLTGYHASFQDFLQQNAHERYDLIVSNPPFHLNSLTSTGKAKVLARHTSEDFFIKLMQLVPQHLTSNGKLTLVLPGQAATLVKELAAKNGLYLQTVIQVRSYPHSEPHREIITLGFTRQALSVSSFNIYNALKSYSDFYRKTLSVFLTIF